MQELDIPRSSLVVSTKIFWGGKGVNDRGLSRKVGSEVPRIWGAKRNLLGSCTCRNTVAICCRLLRTTL